MDVDWTRIPEDHPARRFFHGLADRALTQSSLRDRDIHRYLSDLLIEFMAIESLYKIRDEAGARVEYLVDMMRLVAELPPRQRKAHYKHIGDYSLFVLGMFPESLSRGKRMIPLSYYADTGRRGYWAASELEADAACTVVYRKLADQFEPCVTSLQWVRQYTSDPFYQFMFRQFGILD